MTREEIIKQLDKLQRRWTYHAVEHRQKMENNNPSYSEYDHGVATGFLKALNSFRDYLNKLEPEKNLNWEDIRSILEISDKMYDNCAFEYSQDDCEDILNRFKSRK